jgi:hypothetical protein
MMWMEAATSTKVLGSNLHLLKLKLCLKDYRCFANLLICGTVLFLAYVPFILCVDRADYKK